MPKTLLRRGLVGLMGAVMGVGASALVGPVSAADLEVRVVDRNKSAPLEDASVCLGTSADPGQLGAYRTPSNGSVVFEDVPAAPLTLTVSKPGYRGQRRSLEPLQGDRLLIMQMASGGLGPECRAAVSTGAVRGAGLRVTNFTLDGGAETTSDRGVQLDFNVAGGRATHYRVSENPSFSESAWQPYDSQPTFRLSRGSGDKTVYLQVRRRTSTEGSSLEIISPVAEAAITLE